LCVRVRAGSSTEDVAELLHREIETLVSDPLSDDELLPAKKSAKAGLLEAFGSNKAMARLLCEYEATTGSWTNLLQEPDKIQAVAPLDIQTVARRLFIPNNRIAGHVSMGPFNGFSISAPSM
jgi:predicted Zn-dependent peptidase